ncbi:MAG: phage tail tape measure protein, partial [Propionibacteriaceae bacterium]|nr:phage tail tape measure protein [Propionibacteriaceae bacterium]
MSEATYVPILPDMRKFFSETSKGSRKAGAQAGRDFADGMAREVSRAEKAVDAAARTQERAAARATDATNKRRLEEQKLNEVLEKGTAKASEIMAATQRYEKAQRDEAQAAKNAEKAVQGLERAKRDLNQVTDETSDAVRVGADNLEGFGDAAKGAAGRVGELVAAGAGIAGFGALVSTGMDMSGALSKMNAQLGASGVVAEQNAEAVASALRSGVASGADEAAEAVGALTAQIDGLGSGGEKGAAELSRPLLAFTKTFEVDMAEATQTVGQLLQNDLASDATEAFDLMTTAMQRVPVAMRDELPEVINEYGTHFRGLGFSGEEAFGLLVSAADKGKWALDKTGDALKEFQIRASDGSTATANAYAAIGEDAEAMAVSVAAGGESARLALEYTAESLLAVEDPAERAQHAIALFGTPLEDLSVDQIPQFLEGLTGADEAMAGFQGSSEDLADIVANSLPGRLDALKGTVTDLAGDGFMYLWDSAVKVSDWARDNQSWLTPLIVGFGTLAGIIGGIAVAQNLWNAALGVYRTIQAIATG